MNPRRHVRLLVAIGLIAGLLAVTIGTVIEAMSAGSIQGQEGWSGGTIAISASVNQAIDHSGLNQRTGTGAWRISNNTSLGNHNGAFSGWPFGPPLSVSAGQPSSGAGADQFTATLWFRSASASADGSNIEIDLGTVPGDDRNNFLALTNRADADGGLQLRASEPEGATGAFRPTAIIATGITRSVWHRLDIVANFHDGSANDTVAYALDGVPLANPAGGMTFGTFEGWREGNSFAYALSNRLYFRSGAPPSSYGTFVNTAAQGFYFDDLFYSVANQAAPATRLAAYATGFEPGFSAGSIQSQENWSGGTIAISASVDQTVDHSGLNQRTGTGTWRISNNTSSGNHNGAFSGWVFGPGLPVSAGQPLSGANADQFTATLWFRSASASADGSNIEIDLGTVPGDDRNTFLALTNRADADGGLQLRANEPNGATGTFLPIAIIATGITRSVWHRLDIVATFHDGSANDTVAYALDGVPLANPAGGMTFGTFEGWRDGNSFAYALSNRLFFRSGAPPSSYGTFVNTAAQGFYFDDLFYSVANQSAPAFWLAAYATGFEPAPTPAPDLTISKTHVGNFIQGQIGAQFTVTVTNNGTHSTIGDVTLTDNVPPGLTPTAANGAGWTCGVSGATVSCTRSDGLAPGASYSPVTLTVNVAPSAPASVTNTATISGGGDVNTTNNTATDVTTISPGPDLIVSKSHVGSFTQGQMGATYTVVATNAGASPTSGAVSVIDTVPPGLTPTAASGAGWSCGITGTTVNCSRSDPLAPGASYGPVTLTVNVAPNAPPSVTNIATLSGGGDVNTANNTATDVTTILPGTSQVDLAVTNTDGQTSYTPGTAISYTITVTNAGPSTAAGFSIADNVPATITGVSVACVVTGTGNCGTNGSSANSVSFTAASLAPGAGNMLTLMVAGSVSTSASGALVNTVTVAVGAGATDPNPGNNSATDTNRGRTGVVAEVAGFYAYAPSFIGGVSVAAGDVTGDGVAEIITGAGPGGGPHVRAFSVAGGVTEVAGFFAYDPSFPGGVSVAVADVTGDGVAEIITGAGPGGGPHVRAFSVAGGGVTEVAGFYAYDPAFPGGVNVAAADVTGDGVAEIITGAGPGGGPHVRAFSVAGGVREVAGFYAYDVAFGGGVSVAAADVTGDGMAEIITGAGRSGGPHVRAFSVAGGVTEVAGFYAYDPAFPGGVSVAAADVTGDGVAEIITGPGRGNGPHVRAFGVAGGVGEVASIYAYDLAFGGGVVVAGHDVTGDGIAEIITGAGFGGGPHVRVLDVSGVTVK